MRTGNVVTKVGPWRQRSLFTSGELRPYRKNRWRAIQARLAKQQQERRQNDEWQARNVEVTD